MSTGYRQKVLAEYEKKKANQTLPMNLLHVTAASVRNECAVAFEHHYKRQDESIVRHLVGPRDSEAEYLAALKTMDADKVKALANFLKGKADSTGEKNIELLAFLIGYEPRPYQFNFADTGSPRPFKSRILLAVVASRSKRFYWIGGIILIALGGFTLYSFYPEAPIADPLPLHQDDRSRGCMFWTGDHYRQIPCNVKKSDTLIVGLNPDRLAHFRRITRPDTITHNALGKVWYTKINGKVEFFTGDGFHPVHTERRLHPATKYIIDKYAHP